MYVSPNHPDRERLLARAAGPEAPPVPSGITLYESVRSTQPRRTKLRIALEEYEGSNYVRINIWQQSERGGWWPLPGKCVTIRVGELAAVAEALAGIDVTSLSKHPGRHRPPAREHDQGDDRPQYVERGGRRHERFDPNDLPPAHTGSADFSEITNP